MNPLHLSLFFSKGLSLRFWDEVGMFHREVALYKKLQDLDIKIDFITYGGPSEADYSSIIPGINILSNHLKLPNYLYEKFLHRIHGKFLKMTDIIKTNQMKGADIAFRSSKFWEKSLITRCGYMWSEFLKNDGNSYTKAKNYENRVFKSSKRIIVTTDEMKKNILCRLPMLGEKTSVIPNYVEIDRFIPNNNVNKKYDLLFVGRLTEQKNIESLLYALKSCQLKTMIIGNGPQNKLVQDFLQSSKGKICWKEKVPNSELPQIMNDSSIFILPSHYEGHPKTLIEAMACGMPVIGANSTGIKELIKHGENGFLCSADPESIRDSLETVYSNPEFALKLGENARDFAVKNFSLDRIVEMEMDLYRKII